MSTDEELIELFKKTADELENRGICTGDIIGQIYKDVRMNEHLHRLTHALNVSSLRLPFTVSFTDYETDTENVCFCVNEDPRDLIRVGKSKKPNYFHLGCWIHKDIEFGSRFADIGFGDIETVVINKLASSLNLDVEVVYSLLQDIIRIIYT
jgi:hypothetical protein